MNTPMKSANTALPAPIIKRPYSGAAAVPLNRYGESPKKQNNERKVPTQQKENRRAPWGATPPDTPAPSDALWASLIATLMSKVQSQNNEKHCIVIHVGVNPTSRNNRLSLTHTHTAVISVSHCLLTDFMDDFILIGIKPLKKKKNTLSRCWENRPAVGSVCSQLGIQGQQ